MVAPANCGGRFSSQCFGVGLRGSSGFLKAFLTLPVNKTLKKWCFFGKMLSVSFFWVVLQETDADFAVDLFPFEKFLAAFLVLFKK